jgi:3'-phosphoadenosine 5'-phosphosulfate sulfotransferase (PAPS reductase)/FAD synthetase
MKQIHVLNFGGGVQSTTLYLMSHEGLIQKFDYAIFADTQDESDEVYHHLEWIKSLKSIPILIGTAGKLSDYLMKGENSTGQKFISIPAYTSSNHEGRKNLVDVGRIRRQCTNEFKIKVIEKVIRRKVLGLREREREYLLK